MNNKLTKRVFVAVLGVGLLGGMAWVQALDQKHDHHGKDHVHASLGKPAPAFALKGIDGKEYKLSDFKGKIVVLEWMNHECPFVVKAHDDKLMTGTLAKFKDKPVVWLGIDSSWFCEDKADSIKGWAKKMNIGYPILLDAKGATGHQYGARSTPH
ncbi:MAG: peroxiredoxin family protein, partial [Phycisphaerae bacterium]